MKISKVEATPYCLPIKKFTDAYSGFTTSNAVLIKMHTDEGIEGIGEACSWEPEFYGEFLESVTYAIRKYVGPKLIGLDPLNIHAILTVVDSILARSTCVKEGVDLTLHDLVGKALKVPAYTLLGGRFRENIPVASEIGIDTPKKMAGDALRVLKLGFKAIKIKGSEDMAMDIKRIFAVREALGDDVPIRLDPNAHWDTLGTIKTMKQVEDCHIQYLEQPIPGWDLKGMARIRDSIGIPLMADEGIWFPQDVVQIAELGAADIINIKISKTCGLLTAKRVEAVAEAVGLPCIIGTELEPGFSIAAKLHMAASMSNLPFACEFTELFFLEGNILEQKFKIEDGCVSVPTAPGLGVSLDERAFQKYVYALP